MKKTITILAALLLNLAAISQVSPGNPGKCHATTKAGTPCTRKAVSEGFCKQHDPNAVRCAGKKKDGNPCTLLPKKGEKYCHFHIGKQ